MVFADECNDVLVFSGGAYHVVSLTFAELKDKILAGDAHRDVTAFKTIPEVSGRTISLGTDTAVVLGRVCRGRQTSKKLRGHQSLDPAVRAAVERAVVFYGGPEQRRFSLVAQELLRCVDVPSLASRLPCPDGGRYPTFASWLEACRVAIGEVNEKCLLVVGPPNKRRRAAGEGDGASRPEARDLPSAPSDIAPPMIWGCSLLLCLCGLCIACAPPRQDV
jgi:hypothetical protein